MKPSDFQKTIQCQFDCKLKKVVKGIVRNYRKELARRQAKEVAFCELPEIVIEKLIVWDDYESDYTTFDVCGTEIRVLDEELAEALKQLPEQSRNIVLMFFFLDMSDSEIGEKLNINRRRKKKTITVDGYTGFLFLKRNGLPKTSGSYESMVRGLIKKYNKTHSESEQLPAVTPHSFRHTYCTNMANKGMNPNTLQYVMGHANITMTLGYYAHGSFESARAEIQRLVT